MAFLRTEAALEQIEAALIACHGDLKTACRSVQCCIRDITRWAACDAEVATRVREAQQLGWSTLESAAYERAVLGVEKPVFHRGMIVGYQTEYSDTLLGKLLSARVPGYGEDKQSGGVTVNVAIMPRANSYEEWLVHRNEQLSLVAPSASPTGLSGAAGREVVDAEYSEILAAPSPAPCPITGRTGVLQDVL